METTFERAPWGTQRLLSAPTEKRGNAEDLAVFVTPATSCLADPSTGAAHFPAPMPGTA